MKRIVKKLIISLVCILLICGLFIHFYLPRLIIEIKNPITQLAARKRSIPVWHDAVHRQQKFIYTTFDGLKIAGYIMYADSAKANLILLHGIRGSKEHFANLSKRLADSGYTSIAIDLRAHGQSEGSYTTFGVKEKKDISYLLNYLTKQQHMKPSFGVWGQSLGAAVALQGLAVDKRIKFGIIESTFNNMRQITHDYFYRYFHFDIPWFTNYLIDRAGEIGDFNPDEASPFKACKAISQPVFMVHGDDDHRINVNYGKANFSNLSAVDKHFTVVHNATHLNVWQVGGENYMTQVFNFIKLNTSQKKCTSNQCALNLLLP
ncbi:alpha/beta hydrolase [Zhouia sp. PK063]|uniref:alpha/beta hydrolase n=1 Tax=Zhouia sp. PK063 TaxID=3373602 RepID=UPI00378B066E